MTMRSRVFAPPAVASWSPVSEVRLRAQNGTSATTCGSSGAEAVGSRPRYPRSPQGTPAEPLQQIPPQPFVTRDERTSASRRGWSSLLFEHRIDCGLGTFLAVGAGHAH